MVVSWLARTRKCTISVQCTVTQYLPRIHLLSPTRIIAPVIENVRQTTITKIRTLPFLNHVVSTRNPHHKTTSTGQILQPATVSTPRCCQQLSILFSFFSFPVSRSGLGRQAGTAAQGFALQLSPEWAGRVLARLGLSSPTSPMWRPMHWAGIGLGSLFLAKIATLGFLSMLALWLYQDS